MDSLRANLRYLAVFLCLFLGSCSQPGERPLVVLHPHETAPSDTRGYTSVFLAGTIDMGASEDWQKKAASLFAQKEGSYLLFNPRQAQWHPEREGEMDYDISARKPLALAGG